MGVLDGKVAVITGSTRGFGLAVARAFVREGAAVVVSSRSAESVHQVVTELQAAGGRANGIPADVSDLEQVRNIAAHARTAFGRFDIWVNNAGVAGIYGPTMDIAPEAFVQTIETNILGVYYGSLVAMNYFLARGNGKLINVTGRGAREPVPFQNGYASSKAWIRNFTLALAKEYKGAGVEVLLSSPGMMTTEMLTQVEVVHGYESRLKVMPTILRMWANPPEIPAEQIVHLASAATDGHTGIQVHAFNPLTILSGLVGEGLRRLTGRRTPEISIAFKSIPPARKVE